MMMVPVEVNNVGQLAGAIEREHERNATNLVFQQQRVSSDKLAVQIEELRYEVGQLRLRTEGARHVRLFLKSVLAVRLEKRACGSSQPSSKRTWLGRL
jgi:hypothetical protein